MLPFLLAGSGFHTERLLPSGHAAGAPPTGRITDKEMKTKRADLTELTVSVCNKADFNMATAAAQQEASAPCSDCEHPRTQITSPSHR